jgi:putative ABC transport system permease protein
MDFMVKHDKGLNMDQMLIVNGPQYMEKEKGHQRMISFKNQLLKLSTVKSVTSSGAIPGGGFSFTTGMEVAGKSNKNNFRESIHVVWVDPDFIKTYGIQMVSADLGTRIVPLTWSRYSSMKQRLTVLVWGLLNRRWRKK